MSLREDFQDLAYEMAKIVNDDVNSIEKRALASIEFHQKEMEKKLQKELIKLEKTMMNEELFNLNIEESERIAQINQAIAERKGKCIDDFANILKKRIRSLIESNPDAYISFLRNKKKEIFKLLDSDSQIFFNKPDLEQINQKPHFNTKQKNQINIKISPKPIETAAGFRIVTDNNEIEIDYTFESQLKKYEKEISMIFMNIFPVFEVNVKNALELEKEKHGGS